MPKANWGVSAAVVDDFDPDKFRPYDGPIPPNGVYQFRVKTAKFVAATGSKLPQLRAGMELVPRNRKDERQFEGYFIMAFMTVSDRTQGFYVPFLNAIGVSGRDFETRTLIDEEGNIKSIGKWKNTGDTLVKAEIRDDVDQHGNPRKKLNWFGPIGEAEDPEDEDAGDFDDDDTEEDYEDLDYGDEEDGDDDDWDDD